MRIMHLPRALAVAAGFCALLSAAGESPIPGFELVDVAWDVEVFPGGPHVLLNGTVQDVYEQLIELNPDFIIDLSDLYDEDDDVDEDSLSTLTPSTSSTRSSSLGVAQPTPSTIVEKRQSLRDYFCFGRWPGASRRRIGEGVSYLRRIPGTPTLGPGPGSCGRVSCSYDAAIYMCNDNSGYYTLSSWNLVADGADFINSRCIGGGDTAGQIFYHENWNVIVRQDNC
ncbi:hypothetical protein ASPCAL07724 [Aspergillus calidoustus]|uniref:Secreted protein n=1 Tax=Aspergillus calidoustus TaxID=454130 RepID=A0A0U5GRW6_ASPCI|nr:hypothetical protein ASPCAL07724 [Aspergillus calidoustus]